MTIFIFLSFRLSPFTPVFQTQILFFIVLIISFSNYLVGTFISHQPEKQAQGIFGYRSEL